MAEILLQPNYLSKVIRIALDAKETDSTKLARLTTNRQFNTADTDAWLSFELAALIETTGEYDLTLINTSEAPSSVVHHASIPFIGNVVHYKLDASGDLAKNEIRHAGRWVGQIVLRLSNGYTTSREFDFTIMGHLMDTAEARLILVEDYNALIATITASKDELTQYNVDYAALIADVTAAKEVMNQAEITRQITFDALVDSEMIAQNVETKLTEKETTYAPRLLAAEQQLADKADESALLSVERQLAETTTTSLDAVSKNIVIAPKKPTGKGFVTFVDDDARIEVMTKLLPLAQTYGIPFTIAVPVRNSQTIISQDLTKAQLLDLQNTYGFEMAGHTWTHAPLNAANLATVEYEMIDSKKELESWGLDIKNYVAPFGEITNVLVRETAKKHYNTTCKANAYGAVNLSPLQNYQLERVPLGSYYTVAERGTSAFYKGCVDEALAKDGWVIFMSHVWSPEHDSTQQQNLIDTIVYAQSLGVPIGNLQEGFERYGNVLEIEGVSAISNSGEMLATKNEIELSLVNKMRKTSNRNLINKAKLRNGFLYGNALFAFTPHAPEERFTELIDVTNVDFMTLSLYDTITDDTKSSITSVRGYDKDLVLIETLFVTTAETVWKTPQTKVIKNKPNVKYVALSIPWGHKYRYQLEIGKVPTPYTDYMSIEPSLSLLNESVNRLVMPTKNLILRPDMLPGSVDINGVFTATTTSTEMATDYIDVRGVNNIVFSLYDTIAETTGLPNNRIYGFDANKAIATTEYNALASTSPFDVTIDVSTVSYIRAILHYGSKYRYQIEEGTVASGYAENNSHPVIMALASQITALQKAVAAP